jgi:hypothetical protein
VTSLKSISGLDPITVVCLLVSFDSFGATPSILKILSAVFVKPMRVQCGGLDDLIKGRKKVWRTDHVGLDLQPLQGLECTICELWKEKDKD